MSYQHILVAVDLSKDSQILVKKASDLAKATNAKLSLIYIDVLQNDEFTRQIVSSLVHEKEETKTYQESQQQLNTIVEKMDFPIEHKLVGYGGLSQELEEAIKEYEFDLIVCGHHQDFWHNINSSAKKVMNSIAVDLLIVPLH